MESQHKLGADSARARASKTTKTAAGRRMRHVALTAGVAVLGLSLIGGPAAMAETIDTTTTTTTSTPAPTAPSGTEAGVVDQAPDADVATEEVAPVAADAVAPAAVQFDNVSISEDEQFDKGAVNVDFSLAVPDASKSGDTFTLVYPSLLKYDNTKEALITLPDGTIIARGTLTDLATRTITFTFTDYVDSHRDVTVTGYFGMIVDDPAANHTSKEFVFFQNGQQFTDHVITDPAERPPLTSVYISGEWNATDRGRDVPKGAITWTANLPEGEWAGQTVTISPSNATSLFDCSQVSFYTTEVADGAQYHSSVLDINQTPDGTNPAYAHVVSCSQTELVVTYDQPVDNNFVRQIKIVADAADTDVTSDFGARVSNSNIVLVNGGAQITDSAWFNFVARDVAGGHGDGSVRYSLLSVTKYSAAEGPIDGDFDTAPGKALVAGQSEKIMFDIKNIGTEALTDIKLADTTLSGTPVTLDGCVFDQVVLQPEDTVSCEGTLLPAVSGMYADSAVVTAVTVRDATPTTASDAWYGSVPAPEIIVPTPVVPASLASTGLDATAVPIYLGGSLLLVLAGAAVFFTGRRRTAADS